VLTPQLVELRLYTFDQWGNEVKHDWSFTPLIDEDGYDIYRESEESSAGEPRRRPFDEREVREITLGAGLLRNDDAWASFKRLLRAHRITWKRKVGSTEKWLEYALDEDAKVRFERVKDITRLRRKKITLIQVQSITFTQFERKDSQLAGLRESENA
jgi:hypothetical protein